MVKAVSDKSAEIIYSYDNAPFHNLIISVKVLHGTTSAVSVQAPCPMEDMPTSR